MQNGDAFAWSTTDLTDISIEVMEHHLHILLVACPVKQKRRYFGSEKNIVIPVEVYKLLKVGHIREVYFPT